MSCCVVMGATGYLGSTLVPALVSRGHQVRVFARRPGAVRWPESVEERQGDATQRGDVRTALRGADVVYFLVHSLGRDDFAAVDRDAARILAAAADEAGVRQVVYVGGTQPADSGEERTSEHLASRAEVGRILLHGPVPAVVLQASMIIGKGSISFELLRQLAERSAVVPVPWWMNRMSRPVSQRDVLHYLLQAAEASQPVNGAFEVAGPERISYLALVQRCARLSGAPVRVPVPAPLWPRGLAARLAGWLTPVPAAVAETLFASLHHDLLPRDADASTALAPPPTGPTSVDNAIREALDKPDTSSGTGAPFVDERVECCRASVDEVWRTITTIGGNNGWHTWPLVWTVRGALDHLAGGVGLYRRRPAVLTEGDVVDFWTVRHRDDQAHRLILHADMKMPGDTVLEMSVEQGTDGARYRQTITFTPQGTPGQLYWWLQKPAHDIVFGAMARTIAEAPDQHWIERMACS